MFRDENKIYVNDKGYSRRKEKNIKKLEELREELSCAEFMANRIFPIGRNEMKDKVKDLKIKEAELLDKIKYDKPSFRIKRSLKKISNEKLEKLILEYIVNNNKEYLYKEDLALLFKVKEGQVEQIFHKLNLKGILSQSKHHIPHDSNRDPMNGGSYSGWLSDIYNIIDLDKAQKELKNL